MKQPEHIGLAMLPTPLHPLKRSSELIGASLWVKRDDLTGAAVSGNKIRKIEFLAADAISNGADVLITCGGEQSNHCRATAIVARRLGMDIHLLLRRTAEGPSGNFLLDMILGATIRWVTPEEYEHRDELLVEEADKLRRNGRKPYIIPEGGSNALGIWGYVLAAKELIQQARQIGFEPDCAIVPSGSGGTYAGLWLGFKSIAANTKVIGITAGPDIEEQREHIIKITAQFCQDYQAEFNINSSEIELIDGFWGNGYGVIDEDLVRFISDFARREGIILDPTYTGKAFRGAMTMINDGTLQKNKNIVLWHTGGIFGLFTKGQYFREFFFSGQRVK